MNDEIVKLKGQFSLDINLERGRAIEAVSIEYLLMTEIYSSSAFSFSAVVNFQQYY